MNTSQDLYPYPYIHGNHPGTEEEKMNFIGFVEVLKDFLESTVKENHHKEIKNLITSYLSLPLYVRLEVLWFVDRSFESVEHMEILLALDPQIRHPRFNEEWKRFIITRWRDFPIAMTPCAKFFSFCDFYMMERLSRYSRSNRYRELDNALRRAGLVLRNDSKLCMLWINGHLGLTDKNNNLEDVIRTMAECKWIFDHCDASKRVEEYRQIHPEVNGSDAFRIVKSKLLEETPLPENYPWLNP